MLRIFIPMPHGGMGDPTPSTRLGRILLALGLLTTLIVPLVAAALGYQTGEVDEYTSQWDNAINAGIGTLLLILLLWLVGAMAVVLWHLEEGLVRIALLASLAAPCVAAAVGYFMSTPDEYSSRAEEAANWGMPVFLVLMGIWLIVLALRAAWRLITASE